MKVLWKSLMIASFASEEKWKSELVVAQAAMRDKAHVGLTTLLRQLGAVECRYESTAASARHFVCLQGAIALILAARSVSGCMQRRSFCK